MGMEHTDGQVYRNLALQHMIGFVLEKTQTFPGGSSVFILMTKRK